MRINQLRGLAVQAFLVSVIAGVFFPLLPLAAEFGLNNHIRHDTMALTGLVYAAAVGMGSRSQLVAFTSYMFATVCAIIYGAETYAGDTKKEMIVILYGPVISSWIIVTFGTVYTLERFVRHVIEDEPFLEF
jgi:hypothetical protein